MTQCRFLLDKNRIGRNIVGQSKECYTGKKIKCQQKWGITRLKLVIHDLQEDEIKTIFCQEKEIEFITDGNTITPCIGCFGCWVKTPGTCVIHDAYNDIGKQFSRCSELVIISRCVYGGFSPFVKNVLDRSIPYLHPYFVIKNGEMHHRRRYSNRVQLTVCFYGSHISMAERETAQKLVKANVVNMDFEIRSIYFKENAGSFRGMHL